MRERVAVAIDVRDPSWRSRRYDCLFNLREDDRERANKAQRDPQRLQAMREAWEAWNATVPAIAEDAGVRLGYGAAQMPQR